MMARVFTQASGRILNLPGRKSIEILSGEKGSHSVTLRLVEIPVPVPADEPRGWHHHQDFEECIFVLSGQGTTYAFSGEYPLKAGDTILIPPGEEHVTRNVGKEPLMLLCFFPVANVHGGTSEPSLTPKDVPLS
jgi:mannose-6-phosphate isomerase-like protein (cupin superfamily)